VIKLVVGGGGRFGTVSILVFTTLAFFTLLIADSSLLVDSIVLGVMWALVAAGLTLVFGVMNVANFAQGAFFMVGTLVAYQAYAALSSLFGRSGWLGALVPIAVVMVAAGAGGVLGWVVDRVLLAPLRRYAGSDWTMTTFVVTVALSIFLVNLHQVAFGPQSKGIVGYYPQGAVVRLGNLAIAADRIFAFSVGLTTLIFLASLLSYSQIGRVIRAVADDELGARLVGIPVARIHTIAFTLSGALAGLAGGTLLFLFPSSPYVGQVPLYLAWTVVIVAGLGSVAGTFFAGLVIALLNNMTTYLLGASWTSVVPFLLITVLLLIKPFGLFGRQARGVWDS
jgi:branched-chain amino acid transport system permease protein